MADKIVMKLHMKYRLYILIYCMELLCHISPYMASRLYCHIQRHMHNYIVVEGMKRR